MVKKLTDVARDSLEKQYTYSSVGDLAVKITSVYEGIFGEITKRFGNEILNFNTCTSEALDNFWGQIFKINRNFKDENDNVMTLNDEQFREIIKIRAFGTTWDGSISSMNIFLSELFKDRGNVYMLDPQNMTYEIFVFNFQLENWERYLFANYDIFPRSSGVASYFEEVLEDVYFGFGYYGQLYPNPLTTGFGTYTGDEQGQFLKYDVTPVIGETYKLTIYTQPANAVVRINGKVQNGISFAPNTLYTYEVSCQGYDSYSGSGRITENTILNVNLDSYKTLTIVPTPSDATVVINGQTRNSITVPSGTTYNWTVSKAGYVTQSGSGVITADQNIAVTLLLAVATLTIVPTPSDAVVKINGQIRTSITLNIGDSYSYSVTKEGYYTETGSGIINQDTTLNIGLDPVIVDVYSIDSRSILETFEGVYQYDVSSHNVIINNDLYKVDGSSLTLVNAGGWTFLSKQRVAGDKCYGIKNGDVYVLSETGTVGSKITTEGNWIKTGTYTEYVSGSSNVTNGSSIFLNSNNEVYGGTQTGVHTFITSDADDIGGNLENYTSSSTSYYHNLGWYKQKSTGKISFITTSFLTYDSTNSIYNAKGLNYTASGVYIGTNNVLYNANTSTVSNNGRRITNISTIDTVLTDIKQCTKESNVSGIFLVLNASNQVKIYDSSNGSLTDLMSNCSGLSGIINRTSSSQNIVTAVAISNNKLQEIKYNGTDIVYNQSSINNDYNSIYTRSTSNKIPIILIRKH